MKEKGRAHTHPGPGGGRLSPSAVGQAGPLRARRGLLRLGARCADTPFRDVGCKTLHTRASTFRARARALANCARARARCVTSLAEKFLLIRAQGAGRRGRWRLDPDAPAVNLSTDPSVRDLLSIRSIRPTRTCITCP